MAALLHDLASQGRFSEEASVILAGFPGTETLARQRRSSQPLTAAAELEPLNGREIEILRLFSQHLSHSQIADVLHLSPQTVRNQSSRIYAKLRVHNRPEAILRGQELGLLPLS